MFDRMSRLWAAGKRRWTDARADSHRRDALAYEIACLDRVGELDGALDNIGLGRGAVPFLLKKYPGAVRRYSAVRRRLGIAASDFPSEGGLMALAGPRRRCLLCRWSRRCDKWLRAGGTHAPSFCPGRDVFERQQADQATVARKYGGSRTQ